MKSYVVTIKTIAPYLQAKFGEEAQAGLKVKAGTKAPTEDDDMWKKFLYSDENGIYIPAEHFEGSFENGGKKVKKKPMGSFKDFVKAYFFVKERKIYLNKKEPDEIETSYPARKDGMRVKIQHPRMNEGMEVSFTLEVLSDDIDTKTVSIILEKSGLECGIGARRPRYGRYEVISIV